MAEAGKAVTTGGGRQSGVIPVLQGGDTGGTDVWVGVLDFFRRNDVGGGGHPHGFLTEYFWEAGIFQVDGTWETPAAE